MKIIFFGTPQFAASTLSFLLENGVNIAAVVTKPDRPKGRSGRAMPTPVKIVAESHKQPIPVFQPERVSAPEFAPTLAAFQADLFVVVGYGEIIKQHLLDMPRLGCINLHASLLPKYRGAAPIQHSIINGDAEAGVTIIKLVKKMDAGDMLRAVSVPLGADVTFGELSEKLCEMGSKCLLDVIHDLEKGEVECTPQDESLVTYASKIELEDCEIDWTQSAQTIHNLIRGVNPYPGAWCYVQVRGQKKRLKILKTKIVERSASPGEMVSYGHSGLIIGCGENALQISELQLEGKKKMPAEELMRGISQESFLFI